MSIEESRQTFGSVSLSEAIAQLRSELTESVAAGQAEEIRFEVGEVVVELSLTVEREFGGSGGVKFWVVNADAKASQNRSVIHTLTVPLTPRARDGGPLLTGRS